MLIKSTKQLFIGILFVSSTPSRARIKEPLVVSAIEFLPCALWRPGKGLLGGKGLAFAAPWNSFSVWLTCHSPTLFNIFWFSCSCFASLRPLSQQSSLFNFTFLISCGSALQTVSQLFCTKQFLHQPKSRLCSWDILDLTWAIGKWEVLKGIHRASVLQILRCSNSNVDCGPDRLNLLSLSWNRSHYSSSSPTCNFPLRPP